MSQVNLKTKIREIFLQMIDAVSPPKLIKENLKINENDLHICDKKCDIKSKNLHVVGFGKAVLGMASQCEKILKERLKSGVICIPEGSQKTFQSNLNFSLKNDSVIKIYEGAKNNLPDINAEKGADAIIKLVKSLNSKDDCLIVLISGGGSALLPKPLPGITLTEKLETIKLLASSGANITEINNVRKRLSQVKGGGLASLSYPVKTICLIISDVLNDPLHIIASGPTVPNIEKKYDAHDIIKNYNLESKISANVLNQIKKDNISREIPIMNNSFPHVDNFIIGNNLKALTSGKQYAEASGFQIVYLSNTVEGLVQDVANVYINIILGVINYLEGNGNYDFELNKKHLLETSCFKCDENFFSKMNRVLREFTKVKNLCMMAGGEPTVKVKGNGKGGRSQELAILMSIKIQKLKSEWTGFFEKYDVIFLSAGTDGMDGPTEAAGAWGEANVIEEANKIGLNVNEYLERNDSNGFLSKINNGSYLIKTGHTGTNVSDIHMLIIYEKNIYTP